MSAGPVVVEAQAEFFRQRAIRLEYFTIGWNLVEALVAILAGYLAGRIALVGFGLDSIIESVSGATLLWGCGSGATSNRRRSRGYCASSA